MQCQHHSSGPSQRWNVLQNGLKNKKVRLKFARENATKGAGTLQRREKIQHFRVRWRPEDLQAERESSRQTEFIWNSKARRRPCDGLGVYGGFWSRQARFRWGQHGQDPIPADFTTEPGVWTTYSWETTIGFTRTTTLKTNPTLCRAGWFGLALTSSTPQPSPPT